MASREAAEEWLAALTNIPTASGLEGEVVAWVRRWVEARPGLTVDEDSGGNLLIGQQRDTTRPPVLAVAHMDHPAFVVTADDGSFEFRGGVNAPYFDRALVDVVSRPDGPSGTVTGYDPETRQGSITFLGAVAPGDIAMWRFGVDAQSDGSFRGPACDDLAGVAAALAALDRVRGQDDLAHFGVLLTRSEEVGLIGAIHAAKHQTAPPDARIISIETSRELPTAKLGDGPILRIGDRSTVFDAGLSNRVARVAESAGITHLRKLMDGGACEATAFGAYGYQATGLCLALRNWHNRGNLDEVEAGDDTAAVAMLEEISLDDFHGLVDLLVMAAQAVDTPDSLTASLDELYESNLRYLG